MYTLCIHVYVYLLYMCKHTYIHTYRHSKHRTDSLLPLGGIISGQWLSLENQEGIFTCIMFFLKNISETNIANVVICWSLNVYYTFPLL